MQGLSSHTKIHNQKKIKCSKCEFVCTTLNKLKNHMRIHLDEEIHTEIHTEELSEMSKITTSEKNISCSKTSKRGLSASPEVVDSNKKKNRKR